MTHPIIGTNFEYCERNCTTRHTRARLKIFMLSFLRWYDQAWWQSTTSFDHAQLFDRWDFLHV